MLVMTPVVVARCQKNAAITGKNSIEADIAFAYRVIVQMSFTKKAMINPIKAINAVAHLNVLRSDSFVLFGFIYSV
jgi:hypothetical protein